MKDARCNAWNGRTGHDTLLNGALIGAGILGLLLPLLAPAQDTTRLTIAKGIAMSERPAV